LIAAGFGAAAGFGGGGCRTAGGARIPELPPGALPEPLPSGLTNK